MGLAMALASESDFAFRTWIIDNSGSMVTRDGHRIVETSDRRGKAVRDAVEERETVLYHAELASILRTPQYSNC
jgi:methylase of polypeptide subunit release factors